jgi:hypothetical protein
MRVDTNLMVDRMKVDTNLVMDGMRDPKNSGLLDSWLLQQEVLYLRWFNMPAISQSQASVQTDTTSQS